MPNKTQEKKRARESSSTDAEEESKILEKLSNIQLRIENGFTKVENEMAALKLELKQDILAIKSDLHDLKKSADGAWKEIESLKEGNESLKEQAASALTKNAKLNEEVSALKDRIIKQEDYSRRENLRFYNISENQGETIEECVSKVKDVINSLGMNPNEINFHAIHRVGNRRDRPTIGQQYQQYRSRRRAVAALSSTADSGSLYFKKGCRRRLGKKEGTTQEPTLFLCLHRQGSVCGVSDHTWETKSSL